MQIQPAQSAQWGKGKEDSPRTQEGHLVVDGAMQQKWPCTSTTHVFSPNTLNLIILTSAKCLSLALVTRTIIKMHNLFSLANPRTEYPTAVSLATVCSSSRLKPGFMQSLWPSWGSCARRAELQLIVHPDTGMPQADGCALQSCARCYCSLLQQIITLPQQQKGLCEYSLSCSGWTCQSRR